MRLKSSFKTAMGGLNSHKSRSALTILGIVIGITAIITVMSIGQGAKNLILGEIQGMGSKAIGVAPGRQPQGPSDFAQLFSDSLKDKDFNLLSRKENVPNLKAIMPLVFGGESASYGGETYRITVLGISEKGEEIFTLQPEIGTFISEDDVKGQADVIVIGSKVKKELFGESDALDKKIKIKGKNFKVIGILPTKGQVAFFNFDDSVIIPYTTAKQYIFGIKYFHRFIIEADSEENIERTVDDIKITLRNAHNITDPIKDDFFIETQQDVVERVEVIMSVLTYLLLSVAAISLVVGGIGIMNIMLVSVSERTREIGLRKAVGATNGNILMQFLLEATILTGIGGIIGIMIGALLSFLASFVLTQVISMGWKFAFPLSAAIVGVAVSALVGLIFGIYPARKASRKSPIEALRYE